MPDASPLPATKKLAIPFQRTCNCPENHLNCMTAKDWIKAQIGVWKVSYEKRDIRERAVHPAVMPITLARKAVELFTHRGELVLDPFNGVGTTLLACQDLERNGIGFDLSAKYCKTATERLKENSNSKSEQITICEDAQKIPDYLDNGSVSLIFTSPPYANLLNKPRTNKSRRGNLRRNKQFLMVEQYSQDPRDLGTQPIETYSALMSEIYSRLRPLLKPGGHAVVNVPDTWMKTSKGGMRVPIHISVYHALIEAGYEFRNTIIWDRTNIVNRLGIFGWPSNYITMGTTFEYLLDFWKP
jgi:DNA modification methylase